MLLDVDTVLGKDPARDEALIAAIGARSEGGKSLTRAKLSLVTGGAKEMPNAQKKRTAKKVGSPPPSTDPDQVEGDDADLEATPRSIRMTDDTFDGMNIWLRAWKTTWDRALQLLMQEHPIKKAGLPKSLKLEE